MNNVEFHEVLCKLIHATYIKKNAAYGNSFGDTYQRLGIISAVTRITDKYNRLVTLATKPKIDDFGESIVDTLLDMANYCLMTVIEMEGKHSEDYKKQLNMPTEVHSENS